MRASSSMRLNSSKQAHAPDEASPLKNFPMAWVLADRMRAVGVRDWNRMRLQRGAARLNAKQSARAHLVIQAVRAVEHHAADGDSLGQVLGRLRLARAGRARRRAAQAQVDGAHERAIAAIRQRRDNQARAVAQVLVAVHGLGVDHPHLGSSGSGERGREVERHFLPPRGPATAKERKGGAGEGVEAAIDHRFLVRALTVTSSQ